MADDKTTNGSVEPSCGEPSPAAPDQVSSSTLPAIDSGLPPKPVPTQETVISKRPPDFTNEMPGNSPAELGSSLVGQTLGHFQLEEFVGGGGMGAVFRAVDTKLGRTVAVKILSGNHHDDEILRRFKNEAQSAARLDHENIARVHYVGEDQGLNYIVFEFIEGQNLRDLVVANGPLPLEQAISYTLQVAEALEHASRRDVVHRDIKPSNVLVTGDGHVKLVDMGLARLHQVDSHESDLTASGVTLGTFDYISPEQARDPRSADVKSDLYSLGCTLYFMLTGRPPFPDGTVLQKLLSHTSDDRPDPRLYRPDLPDEIVAILNKLLARHADQRYQRPSELIGELLLVANHFGFPVARGGTVWITPDKKNSSPLRRAIPVIVPAIALILTVAAVDHFMARVDRRQPNVSAQGLFKPQLDELNSVEPPAPGNAVLAPGIDDPTADVPKVAVEPAPDKPPNGQQENVVPAVPVGPGFRSAGVTVGEQPNPLGEIVDAYAAQYNGESVTAGAAGKLPGFALAMNLEDELSAGIGAADVLQRFAESMHAVVPTRLLIVGDSEIPHPADSKVVTSLDQALALAQQLPGVEAVELWFNGPRALRPLEVAIDNLTIRAGERDGVKFQPVIVFQPEQRGLEGNGRMLSIVGGRIDWSDVHFVFRLPAKPSNGWWSLFYLDDVSSFTMRRCTMTVRNAGFDGRRMQDHVAFLELAESHQSTREMMTNEPAMAEKPTSISLSQCIARGEGTLVFAQTALPFMLTWDQGLLVTSDRLFEAGGVPMASDAADRLVILRLEHVTAFLGQGLCLMNSSPSNPHQIDLDIRCLDNIFLTDPYAPLIEHMGVMDVTATEQSKLRFVGTNNFYPNTDSSSIKILWRIASQSESQDTRIIDSREPGEFADWWKEDKVRSRAMVDWRHLPSEDYPIHLRDVADYLLVEDGNPAVRSADNLSDAGFNATRLPSLPTIDQLTPPASVSDASSGE